MLKSKYDYNAPKWIESPKYEPKVKYRLNRAQVDIINMIIIAVLFIASIYKP